MLKKTGLLTRLTLARQDAPFPTQVRSEWPKADPSKLARARYPQGMVRMSLGDNEELGGAVRGLFRRWFFFPDATVEVDGRIVSRPPR